MIIITKIIMLNTMVKYLLSNTSNFGLSSLLLLLGKAPSFFPVFPIEKGHLSTILNYVSDIRKITLIVQRRKKTTM